MTLHRPPPAAWRRRTLHLPADARLAIKTGLSPAAFSTALSIPFSPPFPSQHAPTPPPLCRRPTRDLPPPSWPRIPTVLPRLHSTPHLTPTSTPQPRRGAGVFPKPPTLIRPTSRSDLPQPSSASPADSVAAPAADPDSSHLSIRPSSTCQLTAWIACCLSACVIGGGSRPGALLCLTSSTTPNQLPSAPPPLSGASC
jgi:hypothetical protein